jgi:hypothetical protein
MVTLPMTKTDFLRSENKYITSVASSMGVIRENVKILSVSEISTRSSMPNTRQLLLAISVRVKTSILIAAGQKTYIEDRSVLNNNLNLNGLPNCTLIVQIRGNDTTLSISEASTPAPGNSDSSGSAVASNVLAGAVAGGIVGFIVVLVVTFLTFRFKLRNKIEACAHPPFPHLHFVELKIVLIRVNINFCLQLVPFDFAEIAPCLLFCLIWVLILFHFVIWNLDL